MAIESQLSNGFYLALVYLVISGNYLGNLFGCRVQDLFSNNIYIKHLLGLFTTYFLIMLSTPPDGYNPNETLVLTGIIYFWFFLTTKMQVKFWIPMILLILGSYFLYVYRKQSKAIGENKESIDKLEKIQSVLVILGGIITVLGVVTYYGEKKIEYGSKFKQGLFWFGIPQCRGKTPSVPVLKSISKAFS